MRTRKQKFTHTKREIVTSLVIMPRFGTDAYADFKSGKESFPVKFVITQRRSVNKQGVTTVESREKAFGRVYNKFQKEFDRLTLKYGEGNVYQLNKGIRTSVMHKNF